MTNGKLSNDGGSSWGTDPVAMVVGQTYVRATAISSASRGTAVNELVSVNGVSDTFSVTTFENSAPVFAGTVANQLRINLAHLVDCGLGDLGQERLAKADGPAETCCPGEPM